MRKDRNAFQTVKRWLLRVFLAFIKQIIYKNIYGCDVEDSKNTIRVNISRLKKHLNMDDMSTYEIASTSEGEYVLRRVIF